MKAFQIKIELIGSDPLIWRRVIMPADATFNRLHDVIQTVTNFRSGYPYDYYHLFQFDLAADNIKVTNNEEAYEEHQFFKKNRKRLEEKMRKDTSPEFESFVEIQINNMNTVIRKPTGIKIDQYIEKYGQIDYTYDFGDNWSFLIKLEKTVEDYKHGYPTLIDGAETAPPEDVGGLSGYEDFLEIYHNKNHPDYEEIRAWAEEVRYEEYDELFINRMLKAIKYKKNEW
ncbi:plasmid pRiA4b ORF-3 family protein [Oceanobacillus zhaokaii]|uniref:Plasmid pRiA4b ORF-3 family protein n=1 Tax=Oceanobacillus zhaokaii TaxID=2052660 RepID=A0A345PII3_9BACI|nr:plasmid pRiA4b ORF-3 family protein [Oceanobacillus zhaokaii]AXI09813.1 plasmid pRiA4b ORF-3 family protein [Oceanobacillus zhaokaii]